MDAYPPGGSLSGTGLILLGDRAVLAPLYDLLTYAPYKGAATTFSAMQIGGEYRFEGIGVRHLTKAAATLGISAEDAVEIVRSTRSRALDAFERARDELTDFDDETRVMAATVLDAVARLPWIALDLPD